MENHLGLKPFEETTQITSRIDQIRFGIHSPFNEPNPTCLHDNQTVTTPEHASSC